jgi:hypothetical protein
MIVVGPSMSRVVLELEPETVISGRVIGENGRPLEGVTVGVDIVVVVDGRKKLLPESSSPPTDEDGHFSISNLAAGRYYVSVSTGSFPAKDTQGNAPTMLYPAVVYYGGVTDLAASTPVDLVAGQRAELQFTLSKVPAYTVAGRVIASDEWRNFPFISNSQGQALSFKRDGDNGKNDAAVTAWDPTSGEFEFGKVPAGTYTLLFLGPDQQSSTQKITITRDIKDLKLSPKPFSHIGMTVYREFSTSQPSCWYEKPGQGAEPSRCLDPGVAARPISLDDEGVGWGTLARSLTLDSMAPGKYLIEAQATHGGYVQSVRSGSVDLLRQALTVPEDGTVAPIEVVLRDDSANVKVRVRGGTPGEAVHILALREDNLLPAFRPVSGHSDQEIHLPPLAPGQFRVFAFDSLDDLQYNSPGVLAQYASKASTVTLSANENRSLTIDLIHNERLKRSGP